MAVIDPRKFVGQPMTRRDCVIGGQATPDDYSIYLAGRVIGRIYKHHNDQWYWSINGPYMHGRGSGREQTYEASRAAFKAAFDVWLAAEVAHWEAHGQRDNWVPDGPVWRKGEV